MARRILSSDEKSTRSMHEIMQDEEFDRMFDAYGGGDDDEVGGFHGDDIDDGSIDSDSSHDEVDDGDFLSQLLCHTKAEVLVASARGLANFETVRICRLDCFPTTAKASKSPRI